MTYVYKGDEPLTPRKAHKPRTGRPRTVVVFDPSKCGTRAGYAQHRRHDQDACLQCRVANNAYQRVYAKRGNS